MRRLVALLLVWMIPAAGACALAGDPAREVFNSLWSGDEKQIQEVYQRLSDEAKAQITPQVMAGLKSQLTQAYGELVAVDVSTSTTNGSYQVYLLPVTLERQALQMQLVMEGETIAGLGFVPLAAAATPAPQAPAAGVMEQEITVGEGTDTPLPGILTLPEAGEKLPLAVLVHGSGPNDRNETVGATQLFYDLAQALAREGIASIRYDKRTYVYGGVMTAQEVKRFTVEEETIQDAIRAGTLAQELERIDPERIFIIGHSMGAMLAPRITVEAEGLFKGMALLSGSPKTLLEIIINQNQAAVDGLKGEIKAKQQETLDALKAEARQVLALPESEVFDKTIFGQPAYYFYEMNQYDTTELLQKAAVPALILNGGKDFQVTDDDGYLAWQAAVQGMTGVRLIHAPGLNHLLMVYTGAEENQGTVAEYNTPAALDEDAAAEIAGWINNQ